MGRLLFKIGLILGLISLVSFSSEILTLFGQDITVKNVSPSDGANWYNTGRDTGGRFTDVEIRIVPSIRLGDHEKPRVYFGRFIGGRFDPSALPEPDSSPYILMRTFRTERPPSDDAHSERYVMNAKGNIIIQNPPQDAKIVGNIYARGNISGLRRPLKVYGDVRAGGNVEFDTDTIPSTNVRQGVRDLPPVHPPYDDPETKIQEGPPRPSVAVNDHRPIRPLRPEVPATTYSTNTEDYRGGVPNYRVITLTPPRGATEVLINSRVLNREIIYVNGTARFAEGAVITGEGAIVATRGIVAGNGVSISLIPPDVEGRRIGLLAGGALGITFSGSNNIYLNTTTYATNINFNPSGNSRVTIKGDLRGVNINMGGSGIYDIDATIHATTSFSIGDRIMGPAPILKNLSGEVRVGTLLFISSGRGSNPVITATLHGGTAIEITPRDGATFALMNKIYGGTSVSLGGDHRARGSISLLHNSEIHSGTSVRFGGPALSETRFPEIGGEIRVGTAIEISPYDGLSIVSANIYSGSARPGGIISLYGKTFENVGVSFISDRADIILKGNVWTRGSALVITGRGNRGGSFGMDGGLIHTEKEINIPNSSLNSALRDIRGELRAGEAVNITGNAKRGENFIIDAEIYAGGNVTLDANSDAHFIGKITSQGNINVKELLSIAQEDYFTLWATDKDEKNKGKDLRIVADSPRLVIESGRFHSNSNIHLDGNITIKRGAIVEAVGDIRESGNNIIWEDQRRSKNDNAPYVKPIDVDLNKDGYQIVKDPVVLGPLPFLTDTELNAMILPVPGFREGINYPLQNVDYGGRAWRTISGDHTITSDLTLNGILYVNGNLTIKENATITGTGALVATGTITVEKRANLNFTPSPVALFARRIEITVCESEEKSFPGPIHATSTDDSAIRITIEDNPTQGKITFSGDIRTEGKIDINNKNGRWNGNLSFNGIIRSRALSARADRITLNGRYVATTGSQEWRARTLLNIYSDVYNGGNALKFWGLGRRDKSTEVYIRGNVYNSGRVHFNVPDESDEEPYHPRNHIFGSIYSRGSIDIHNADYVETSVGNELISSGDIRLGGNRHPVLKIRSSRMYAGHDVLIPEPKNKLSDPPVIKGTIVVAKNNIKIGADSNGCSRFINCILSAGNDIHFDESENYSNIKVNGGEIRAKKIFIDPKNHGVKIEIYAPMYAEKDIKFVTGKKSEIIYKGDAKAGERIIFGSEDEDGKLEIKSGSTLWAKKDIKEGKKEIKDFIIKGDMYAGGSISLDKFKKKKDIGGNLRANDKISIDGDDNLFKGTGIAPKITVRGTSSIEGYPYQGRDPGLHGEDVYTKRMPPLDISSRYEWRGWAKGRLANPGNNDPRFFTISDDQDTIKCYSGAEYLPYGPDGNSETTHDNMLYRIVGEGNTGIGGDGIQILNHNLSENDYRIGITQDKYDHDNDNDKNEYVVYDGWIDYDGAGDRETGLSVRASSGDLSDCRLIYRVNRHGQHSQEKELSLRKDPEKEGVWGSGVEALYRYDWWEIKSGENNRGFIGYGNGAAIEVKAGDILEYKIRAYEGEVNSPKDKVFIGNGKLGKTKDSVDYFRFEIGDDDITQPVFGTVADAAFPWKGISINGNMANEQSSLVDGSSYKGDTLLIIDNNIYRNFHRNFLFLQGGNFTLIPNVKNTFTITVRDLNYDRDGDRLEDMKDVDDDGTDINGIDNVRLLISLAGPYWETDNKGVVTHLRDKDKWPAYIYNKAVTPGADGVAKFNLPKTLFSKNDIGKRFYFIVLVADRDNEGSSSPNHWARVAIGEGIIQGGRIVTIRSVATITRGREHHRKTITAVAEVDSRGRTKRIISWDVE